MAFVIPSRNLEEWPDDEFTDRNSELDSNPDFLPPPPPPPLFEAQSVEITEYDFHHAERYDDDDATDTVNVELEKEEEDVEQAKNRSDAKNHVRSNQKTPNHVPWYRHARVVELYTSADYWSVWYGLILYGLTNAMVFIVIPLTNNSDEKRRKYVVPQPMMWTNNPWDAWDVYGLVGTVLLLTVLGVVYLVALHSMRKLTPPLPVVPPPTTVNNNNNEDEEAEASRSPGIPTKHQRPVVSVTAKYIYGYTFMCVLATLSLWVGSNQWCNSNGLGYAVFAIFFGVTITNIPTFGNYLMDHYIGLAATDGEFFIKCSLVLLAVQFNELIDVGAPGMVVAWIGSPLSILIGFWIGTRYMHCDATVVILIAVGASWCGASAISAVAPIVAASSEQVSLAVSVVSFFTLGFTFIQPYIAIAAGMPDDIAGAWIGGSIDQTGNVIVSAAIISEEATEVASIVKMVLNAALGVMASVIACWWYARKPLPDDDHKEEDDNNGNHRKTFNLITLWDKFPKFTIGFIVTSALLTITIQHIEGTPEAEALPRAIASMNRWLFAISFVGIGLTTNIAKLWEKAIKSGIIPVYLVVNMFDIMIALGLAYLVY